MVAARRHYQIYPRSFADSDGDGVGDLPGIIAKLDYLRDLGVDAIWLSPIYPSPGRDVGYDVSDHTAVDPLFGGDAEFDRFVAAAHRRGLRVVLDMVMNHTSDQHPWFQASRSSRDGPYADWYLWRDPAGLDAAGQPDPTEQLAVVVRRLGVAVGRAAAAVLHAHLPRRAARAELAQPTGRGGPVDMVRGWLERGVDGFRLDVFNAFLKHPELLANPDGRGRHALGAPGAHPRPRSA